jgi:histone deacetylase 1/2
MNIMRYVLQFLLCSKLELTLFKYYGPDYELDVRASNMENANSNDYLEKIKMQVIENLKKTTFAPSVQMQDVPRDPMGMTEEEEAELDDADEDENKDVRHTERRWDRNITRDDELYESEDEEDSRMNGIRSQNGKPKRRNIMDYQNPHAVPDDIEMDSGMGTPEAAMNDVDDMVTALAAEADAEADGEVMESKKLDPGLANRDETGPSNAASRGESPREVVDGEGDVDMDSEAAQPDDTDPLAPADAPDTLPRSPTPAGAPLTPPPAEDSPHTASGGAGHVTEPNTTEPIVVKQEGNSEGARDATMAEVSAEIAEQSEP